MTFTDRFVDQVSILRQAGVDAVISVGAYAACAAFIRDARDAGWNLPIANLSFVGSENLGELLIQAGQSAGTNYTGDLINAQVVPSYENIDTATALEDRSVGGLGIYLVRSLMDEVAYRREDGQNVLAMRKRASGASSLT
jgi:hypothetical protein